MSQKSAIEREMILFLIGCEVLKVLFWIVIDNHNQRERGERRYLSSSLACMIMFHKHYFYIWIYWQMYLFLTCHGWGSGKSVKRVVPKRLRFYFFEACRTKVSAIAAVAAHDNLATFLTRIGQYPRCLTLFIKKICICCFHRDKEGSMKKIWRKWKQHESNLGRWAVNNKTQFWACWVGLWMSGCSPSPPNSQSQANTPPSPPDWGRERT